MEIKKDIFQQILTIVNTAHTNAVRKVDNERMLMYWQIGKLIFEEEQQGEERATYGTFLLNQFQLSSNPSLIVAFPYVSWNVTVNFTECSQLRPHCGRNSVGRTIEQLLIDEVKKEIEKLDNQNNA